MPTADARSCSTLTRGGADEELGEGAVEAGDGASGKSAMVTVSGTGLVSKTEAKRDSTAERGGRDSAGRSAWQAQQAWCRRSLVRGAGLVERGRRGMRFNGGCRPSVRLRSSVSAMQRSGL
jgi:hypothetical protein